MADDAIRIDYSDFREFSMRLRAVDRGLYKEFAAAARKAARDGRNELRAGWRATPDNEWTKGRDKNIVSSVAINKVRITDKNYNQALLNQGVVRHPVFGNKDEWVTTARRRNIGWWDGAVEKLTPKLAEEIHKQMTEYVGKAFVVNAPTF